MICRTSDRGKECRQCTDIDQHICGALLCSVYAVDTYCRRVSVYVSHAIAIDTPDFINVSNISVMFFR